MHWKAKAVIQNAIALLPVGISNEIYYRMQRVLGGLSDVSVLEARFVGAAEIWDSVVRCGCNPVGKHFFEVGTGRVPVLPISFWLMGAASVTTFDLNRYMKRELVEEILGRIQAEPDNVRRILGRRLVQDRLERVLALWAKGSDAEEVMELCNVKYTAPGDATETGIASNSVDVHVSYTVLEHVLPEILGMILEEGARILTRKGLFVHQIDYTDHFSHSDSSISMINFLRFSDLEWSKWAGNRFMYMNRLRHDDFEAIFESHGHEILETVVTRSAGVRRMLVADEIKLDPRFSTKDIDVLDVIQSGFVTRKKR